MESQNDMEDYWNECKLLPSLPPEDESGSRSCEEGELEAEWLEDAGLGQLTAAFQQGREVAPVELDQVLVEFSNSQAEAIKRRVRTLNNTVRQRRARSKHRKADVRDLFKDVEPPNSTQSRSATPDSLDSLPPYTTTIQVTDGSEPFWRRPLSRAPSAPLSHQITSKSKNVIPTSLVQADIFRNYMPDVAGSVTDGLHLVRYQYLGTLPRHRCGSDPPSLDEYFVDDNEKPFPLSSPNRLSRSHDNLLDLSQSYRDSSQNQADRTWVDSLDISDIGRLRPVFLVEVTAIFDKHTRNALRRKPQKPHRKSEGSIFGAPLSSLIEKDSRAFKDDVPENAHVPAIIQMLVNHLEHHALKEEGLLRVAGVKTRIDSLIATIESKFYQDKKSVEATLYQVSPHDIASSLKKLFRELPEPILTFKLLHMFYFTHDLPNDEKRKAALNLLVLLLPREHQCTLLLLFRFVNKLVEWETFNKMGYQSIATILAPSLFPPRYIIQSKEDVGSQVALAENCVRLTETLLRAGEALWLVPRHLIQQLRSLNGRKENSKPWFWGGPTSKASPRRSAHDNVILVEARQFGLPSHPIRVTETMTAKDVVFKVTTEGMKAEGGQLLQRGGRVTLSELAPPGLTLSCVLACASPEMVLQTHFLYERGGNIVQRGLEHSALISSVLKENPGASWRLECRHRNCPKR